MSIGMGDIIRTTKDKLSMDWYDNQRARERPWNVHGKVVGVANSHGLCFKVLFDHNNTEWYEESEVEEVKQ